MRPNLTKEIPIEDFKNFYWLKKELEDFCKENEIYSYGPKIELTERIELFLINGTKIQKKTKTKKKTSNKKGDSNPLTLDTIITENHRCSQNVRLFFKSVIPNFHFSTHIQNYFKENIGKTYKDALNEWNEEEKRKKDPSYKKNIGPQFEYNQFTHDYFKDPANKGKTRKDATNEWNIIKKLPGDNKYKQK